MSVQLLGVRAVSFFSFNDRIDLSLKSFVLYFSKSDLVFELCFGAYNSMLVVEVVVGDLVVYLLRFCEALL